MKKFILSGIILLLSLADTTARTSLLLDALKPKAMHPVHIKVVVNSTFASNALWKNNVHTLISAASKTYESWINVNFVVDTMIIWDVEKSLGRQKLFVYDCLMKEIPRGRSDIVVYFMKELMPTEFWAGISLYTRGYVMVKQIDDSVIRDGFQIAFHTLVHELGHVFGATHTYFDNNGHEIMNPSIHDKLVEKVGKERVYTEPEFHRGNVTIMTALANRPFGDTIWSGDLWKNIRRAYNQTRREYCSFSITASGEIANHTYDEFIEAHIFGYLSSWAQMCGRESLAIRYLDTLDLYYQAVNRTCKRQGVAGNQKICSECCRSGTAVSDAWLLHQRIAVSFRKAEAYLFFGKIGQADSCFNWGIGKLTKDDLSLQEKLSNGYDLTRTLYLRNKIK